MSTSTYEQLAKLFRDHPEIDFCEVLAHHLYQGHVICCENYCIIGEEIEGGWWIFAASGPGAIHHFVESMPYHLPWVGWQRHGGKAVWRSTGQVLRILNKLYDKQ